MNSCFCRKVQRQMFLFFPAAIFVPLKGTPTWRSINLGEYFSKDLAYEISHRPDSCRGFLYICLLLFPRFCTFCIEWFATLTHISQPISMQNRNGKKTHPFPTATVLMSSHSLWSLASVIQDSKFSIGTHSTKYQTLFFKIWKAEDQIKLQFQEFLNDNPKSEYHVCARPSSPKTNMLVTHPLIYSIF